MAEWTPEASEYLEGYLKQVHALARSAELDADEIVQGLREHVEAKVAEHTQSLLPIDVLVALLAEVGTPQQIIATGVSVSTETMAASHPSAPRRGRRMFAVTLMLFLLIIGVVGVPIMAVGAYLTTAKERPLFKLPTKEADPEKLERAMAKDDVAATTSVLREIAVAQSKFIGERIFDADKDGISDYGTLQQLTEAGTLSQGRIALELTCEPYLLNLVTTPSANPGGPSYTCEAVCIPTDPLRPTIRLDRSGAITEVKPLVETIFPDEKAR